MAAAENDVQDDYRSLFEDAPIAYHEIDCDGVVRRVNAAECKLLGLAAAQVVGRPVWDFVAPELRERVRRAVSRKIAGEQPLEPFEPQYVLADGRRIDVEIHDKLIRNVRGEVTGLRSIVIDLTDRRKAEQAARDAEERYRDLVERAPIGIYQTTPDGRVLTVNPALLDLLGCQNVGEVYDRNLDTGTFEPDYDRAAFKERLEREGEVRGLETVWRRRDGSWAFVREHSRARRGPDGKVICYEGTVEDITDRKHAEQKLREYAAELGRANADLAEALSAAREATKLKSRLLANMSHEIRTPMNGVLATAELLLGTSLDGEQREYVETIKLSADALLRILNDILDLSKIEAGKLQLESVRFDLTAVLTRTVNLFRGQAGEGGLSLELAIGQNVPQWVRGDPGRIGQVVANLVGNAVKFTHQGMVQVAASLRAMAGGGATIAVEVTDTGIGIPPEEAGRLFESFVQGDGSTTRRYGGTGLGLAICRQLVEAMKGRIWCASQQGKGSTFGFEVPLEVAEAASDAPREPEKRPAGAGEGTGAVRLRILLAEDNEVNRRIAVRLLQKAGHDAVAVNGGRAALEECSRTSYDLILMDVHMPDVDGFQATAAIRRLEAGVRHTPIIAMTASAMAGDREQCLEAGMDDYIAKPIQTALLEEVIRRWTQTALLTP